MTEPTPIICIIGDIFYKNPFILRPPGWTMTFNQSRMSNPKYKYDLVIVLDPDPAKKLEEFYDIPGNGEFLEENVFLIKTNEHGFPTVCARQKFIKAWLIRLATFKIVTMPQPALTIMKSDFMVARKEMLTGMDDLIWWSGLERKYSIAYDRTKTGYPAKLVDSHGRKMYYILTTYKKLTHIEGVVFLYDDNKRYDILMMEPSACMNIILSERKDWIYFGQPDLSFDKLFQLKTTGF